MHSVKVIHTYTMHSEELLGHKTLAREDDLPNIFTHSAIPGHLKRRMTIRSLSLDSLASHSNRSSVCSPGHPHAVVQLRSRDVTRRGPHAAFPGGAIQLVSCHHLMGRTHPFPAASPVSKSCTSSCSISRLISACNCFATAPLSRRRAIETGGRKRNGHQHVLSAFTTVFYFPLSIPEPS